MLCHAVLKGFWIQEVMKIGRFLKNLFCPKKWGCKHQGSEFKQFLLFKIRDLKILHRTYKLETILTISQSQPRPFRCLPRSPPASTHTQIQDPSLPEEMLQRRGKRGEEGGGGSCLPLVTISQQPANVPSSLAVCYTSN